MAPEDPIASSTRVFALLEQVTVGGPGPCAVLAGSVRGDLSLPVFPMVTKDHSGLGRGFPFLAGKLPKALNPPCAALSSSKRGLGERQSKGTFARMGWNKELCPCS